MPKKTTSISEELEGDYIVPKLYETAGVIHAPTQYSVERVGEQEYSVAGKRVGLFASSVNPNAVRLLELDVVGGTLGFQDVSEEVWEAGIEPYLFTEEIKKVLLTFEDVQRLLWERGIFDKADLAKAEKHKVTFNFVVKKES